MKLEAAEEGALHGAVQPGKVQEAASRKDHRRPLPPLRTSGKPSGLLEVAAARGKPGGEEVAAASGKPPLLPGGGTADPTETSTGASGEAPVDLEDTFNSNASKEFSFGTTKPAQLPAAPDLEYTAAAGGTQAQPAASDSASPSLHASPPRSGMQQVAQKKDAAAPPECDELLFSESAAGESANFPGKMSSGHLSPKSDSDGGELTFGTTNALKLPDPGLLQQMAANAQDFSFGTTTPLQLPDPALLRQMASAQDAPVGPATGCRKLSHPDVTMPNRSTPRWEPAEALAPVQEVSPQRPLAMAPRDISPPPPLAPPDQAVALRSFVSPQRSRSDLEITCFTPPATSQMHQMPAQYYHAQVAQTWHGQEITELPLQPSLQDCTHGNMNMLPENMHGELQKQHPQVHELHADFIKGQHLESQCHPDSLSSTLAMYSYPTCDSMSSTAALNEYPLSKDDAENQSSEAYSPYFGDEVAVKVQKCPGGKLLAATCCIVLLVVLAVGGVVVFVETAA